MPVIAEYTPPPQKTAARPCCTECASPSDRAAMLLDGAQLLAGAMESVRRRRRGLGADESADAQEENTLFWTPTAVHSYVDKANTEIWALATDYSAAIRSGAISQAQLQAFKAFYIEWQTWYDSLGFFSWLSGATAATASSFRQRALAWRNQLKATGAPLSSPDPKVGSTPSELPSTIKWVAGAAVAVAGVYALSQVVHTVGVFRSSSRRVA